MADEADANNTSTAKKGGGIASLLVNGVGIFILTLGAVVAGGYINAKLHPAPEMKLEADGKITAAKPEGSAKGAGTEQKASLYLALDPPLVVNFEDGAVVRFLQITMEVMTKEQAAIDGVQKNLPLIRNNLLLLMSNRDFAALMSREGKEKLRAEALAEVQDILKKQGSPAVDDLLFTSFVVQ